MEVEEVRRKLDSRWEFPIYHLNVCGLIIRRIL